MSSNSSKSSAESKREKITVKVLVLGCANVGKSSLIERYVLGRFHGKRIPTVGADHLSKKLIIDDVEVTIQIWDTAGQERFHPNALGASFYRGAHGALLVYDVNDEKSFEQISLWCEEVLSKLDPGAYFPMVVVGNKVDIRNTSVDSVEDTDRVDQSIITDWCLIHSYGHVETSAKDGSGVEAAMTTMAALALEAHRLNARKNSNQSTNEKPSKDSKIKISDMYEVKQNKSWC